MAKYDPLRTHLKRLRRKSWEATFAEIEEIIDEDLPPSARTHRPWWSNTRNERRVHARAWMDTGWRVVELDIPAETVKFRRID